MASRESHTFRKSDIRGGWKHYAARDLTLHFRTACSRQDDPRPELAAEYRAVLISEDVWLSKLSDGISSFDDYLKWSRRCRSVMGPLIIEMLRAGVCVVLDFAGNRVDERAWARNLSEGAGSSHILHFLDVDEEECLRRLLVRNDRKPEGLYFASTTEVEFRAICKYRQVPTAGSDLPVVAEPKKKYTRYIIVSRRAGADRSPLEQRHLLKFGDLRPIRRE